MRKLFKEVETLDRRAYKRFHLTEEILQEQAGNGISNYIRENYSRGSRVLIVAGGGNNGADGVVIARQLNQDYRVKLLLLSSFKSEIGKLQLKRAISIGVEITNSVESSDILIDAIFGTGLSRELSSEHIEKINLLNSTDGYKIAVDIPSGIDENGKLSPVAFRSDRTFTMGALKLSLFSDEVKDYTGKIEVVNLGLSRELYEDVPTQFFKLTEDDMVLPYREVQNSHKGSYGHTAILSGEREGASIISANAALNFGSGLVTVVRKTPTNIPFEIMQKSEIPKNSRVIVAGMGLGQSGISDFEETLLKSELPLVLDADIFYSETLVRAIMETRCDNIILTPHPREFQSILSILFKIELSIEDIVSNRVELLKMFSKRYNGSVILLKGANSLIAHKDKIYFDTYGNPNLAKGGSGDVLAGMVGALIAQGYSPIKATITASLAHSFASQNYKGNCFTLSPNRLIEELSRL